MFHEVRTYLVEEVRCSICDKKFVYEQQDKCPHCGSDKEIVAISDLPF